MRFWDLPSYISLNFTTTRKEPSIAWSGYTLQTRVIVSLAQSGPHVPESPAVTLVYL